MPKWRVCVKLLNKSGRENEVESYTSQASLLDLDLASGV